ncbi:MAG: hypothetical protein LBM63_02320 [Rikenellaceae bacterium]|nr:hypothetical protein [Rikenellaceae bacterium]
MKKIFLLPLAAVVLAGCASGGSGELPLVYEVENRAEGLPVPPLPTADQAPSVATLPDPFEWSDGSGRVEKLADWTRRRGEIIAEIEHYELGAKPPRPETLTATWSPADSTLTVTMTQGGDTLRLSSKVVMPQGAGPHPVIIGVNLPTGSLPPALFDDFIQIPFVHNQVSMHSAKDTSNPVYRMFPSLATSGNYAAWSWGISRLVDGLELVAAEMGADVRRVAVTGCSYAGKMALFAGALDERIALTIVQESGGGGINSWRVSETLGNVEKISNTNYDWFLPSLRDNFDGRADRLPYDHHELIALIAPRPVLILGNPDYGWLADQSGYVSTMAALEVWRAMGVPERIGFDFSPEHPHCLVTDSQQEAITAFIDRFFRGVEDVDTAAIRTAPLFGEVDYATWMPWAGATLR